MNKIPKNDFCPLTDLTLISVSGPDAKRFLQGQLSCNLDEITHEHTSLAAHCTPKGRVIALMRVFKYNDEYGLLINNDIKTLLLNSLKKYALFSKVQLQDLQENRVIFGLIGHEIVEKIATSRPSLNQENNGVEEEDFIWIRIPGPTHRILVITDQKGANSLRSTYSEPQTLAEPNLWKLLDIRAGLPQIYSQTSGLFTPHHINLQGIHALSFNKGCYTGQEVIARMHYLGKLKQELKFATVAGKKLIQPGDILVNDPEALSPVGYVVDAVMNPEGQYELLISVKISAWQSGEVYLQGTQVSPQSHESI